MKMRKSVIVSIIAKELIAQPYQLLIKIYGKKFNSKVFFASSVPIHLPKPQLNGGSRGSIGAIDPPKTYKTSFFHHDFVQFGKQHARYKAILSSTVFLQQYCEIYFISLTVVNP